MTKETDKDKKSKRKVSGKPKLSVVVPFPEDKLYRDRQLENLIRRLRRAKLSEVVIVGTDGDGRYWNDSNGIDRVDCLWLLEVAKMEMMGIINTKE